MRTKYFLQEPQTVAQNREGDRLAVRALVFYEGDHVDGSGKAISYSAEKIAEIAANSNAKLEQGVRVQLFKDHEYSSDSVIGTVLKFEAAEITQDKLPHKGMDELLGRLGVFAQIEISGEENITRYKDNRIKSVSSGIDLEENYIYEVSVVPFPALSGASLFERYGLTMGDTKKEKEACDKMMKLQEIISTFMQTSNDIDLASTEELQGRDPDGLRTQAVQDLAASLYQFFGVNAQPQNPQDKRGLMEPKEKAQESPGTYDAPPKEDTAKYAAEIAQLKAQLQQAEKERLVTAKFHTLRQRGEELRDAGKLTPAAFNELFGDASEAIAKYSKGDSAELSNVEFYLDMLGKFGAPSVEFGRVTESEPKTEEFDTAEVEARARRLAGSVIKFGGRR